MKNKLQSTIKLLNIQWVSKLFILSWSHACELILDLNTMTSRLKTGYYNCLRLFIADMRRIFTNCKMFNERNSDYVRSAQILEKVFISKMKENKLWIDFT